MDMTDEQVEVLETIIKSGGQIQSNWECGGIGAYAQYTVGTYAEVDGFSLADLANALMLKNDLLSLEPAT